MIETVIEALFPYQPECVQDAGSWCARFYQWTHVDFLARSADQIMTVGSRILLIVVLALLARWFLHRLIKRVVDGATNNRLSSLVKRTPQLATKVSTPRSAQRARTIGSVLRSITSAVVLVIAAIMVLAEFGVDLAPILASAGIIGVAVGFGAQNLVKDFLSGMFMLLEDQYGVGDIIDVGEASGTVEAVGLRITTLRDVGGTVWYVRNGEIQRVGNKSQGYAVAVVDLPIGHSAAVADVAELAGRIATERLGRDDVKDDVLEAVEVLGVDKVSNEGQLLRLTVRVNPGKQFAVQRALNAALSRALDEAHVPRPGAAAPAPLPPARPGG